MERFGLKEEVVSFLVDAAARCDLDQLVLFGSRATGRYSEKSDVDLALLGGRIHDFQELIEEECPTLLSFDFIDMSADVSQDLIDRIEAEGVVLRG